MAIVLLLMWMTAACNSNTAQKASGGTITWALNTDAKQFDPQASGTSFDFQILNRVYQGLTTFGNDGSIQPLLATSWETPSPTTYVFHLRAGVKFSNGRVMTGEDVVGTFNRMFTNQASRKCFGYLGQKFRSITATDSLTVRIELAQPFTPLLAGFANYCAAILPMKELTDGTFDPAKDWLGAGPFKVDQHLKDQSWALSRNPNYWRADYPKIDKLVVKIIPDDSAQLAGLRDGTVDVAYFANVDAPLLLAGIPSVKTVIQNTPAVSMLYINALSPNTPFRDARVRQAVSMAIDRQQIVNLALGGHGRVSGPIPPFFGQDSCNLSSLPTYQHNLTRAKELLQEAGAQNLNFTLNIATGFPTYPFIAQVIQQNEAAIGVKVNVQTLELGALVSRLNSAQFDAMMAAPSAIGDPTTLLSVYNPQLASYNKGWAADDPELDQLIVQAQSSAGPSRKQILQQVCAKAEQVSNNIALTVGSRTIGYRSDHISPTIQSTDFTGFNPLISIEEFTVNH